MANHTPAKTTEWVASNLRKAAHVTKVDVLAEQVLSVSRDKYPPYVAGIVSVKCVKVDDIIPLVESKFGVEIIVNVPKESYWTGEAIMLAQVNSIATGSYGDLLRVIDEEEVRAFQQKETTFIERGLRQHDRISNFKREHDRLYHISRDRLPDLKVAMLNEYELTAVVYESLANGMGNSRWLLLPIQMAVLPILPQRLLELWESKS
jgi:hypothetical protein